MDVNWTLTVVGSILGSIVLAIIGNLLTNPIQNRLAHRSLVSQRKRVEALKAELDYFTELHQDKMKIYLESALAFFKMLFLLSLAMIILVLGSTSWTIRIFDTIVYPTDIILSNLGSTYNQGPFFPVFYGVYDYVSLFAYAIAIMLFGICLVGCVNHLGFLRKLRYFEKYKKETETQIEKLEAKTNQVLTGQ